MKRKRNSKECQTKKDSNWTGNNITKVIIEELHTHPWCDHGPTILFENITSTTAFYSCSAFRNRKKCPFYRKKSLKTTSDVYSLPSQKLARSVESPTVFCHTCQKLYDKVNAHECRDKKDHEIETNTKLFKRPSILLKNLEDSKAQAQFHFSQETLNVITETIDKKVEEISDTLILFIGAPSVYEELKSKQTAAEMLVLDIDIRLAQFLPNEEFCHYNMFNHHFFDSESVEIYKSKISRNYKSIIVITDPPFGGRPELISWTLQKIEKELKCELFHMFWIFPYFMEPKIKTVMPALHMSDYQVTYQEIGSYKQGQQGRRSQGSPVRIFTNIPLHEIDLKHLDSKYRMCHTCHKYVAVTNRHCHECQNCTAKNGGLYRHCHKCARCVKFSYKHCSVCQRCALPDHPCELFCKKRRSRSADDR